jgi:hypothetical protein
MPIHLDKIYNNSNYLLTGIILPRYATKPDLAQTLAKVAVGCWMIFLSDWNADAEGALYPWSC